MATRRGKSQARRNTGHGNALPGWAWLILGLLLGIGLLLAAPKFLKSDGDGFFRQSPRANPDAQPGGGLLSDEDELPAAEGDDANRSAANPTAAKEPDFDFYTVLPGEEVAMTDAQLAATAREERERHARTQSVQQAQQQAAQAATAAASGSTLPPPITDTTPTPSLPTISGAATTTPATSGATEARYILQAGAFGASGDAEQLKARIALIGLGARVESANINGKTMYRVRMGPYGTASELAEAKAKLGSNGLPAMAIKAR